MRLESDKVKRPVPRIEEKHVRALETAMDRMTEPLGPLTNFILPGGSPGRRICTSRAPSAAAPSASRSRLRAKEPIGPLVIAYLNRLSDALFVMARWENRHRGVEDVTLELAALNSQSPEVTIAVFFAPTMK